MGCLHGSRPGPQHVRLRVSGPVGYRLSVSGRGGHFLVHALAEGAWIVNHPNANLEVRRSGASALRTQSPAEGTGNADHKVGWNLSLPDPGDKPPTQPSANGGQLNSSLGRGHLNTENLPKYLRVQHNLFTRVPHISKSAEFIHALRHHFT